MKSYRYFIVQDLNDSSNPFMFIDNNKHFDWWPTTSDAIFSRIYKSSDKFLFASPYGERTLTYDEVEEELINMGFKRWEIIYFSNTLPTKRNYPELYL